MIRTLLTLPVAFLTAAAAASEYRTFLSTDGNTIRAKVLNVSGGKVQVIREDGKNFIFPVDRLSESDREYLQKWKPDTAQLGDPGEKYHPSLYPRSRKEIKDGIKAIFDRDTANKSFTDEENEALAVMNAYRFPCSALESAGVLDVAAWGRGLGARREWTGVLDRRATTPSRTGGDARRVARPSVACEATI